MDYDGIYQKQYNLFFKYIHHGHNNKFGTYKVAHAVNRVLDNNIFYNILDLGYIPKVGFFILFPIQYFG